MGNFEVKLISISSLDPSVIFIYNRFYFPYGLGVLAAFLRDNNHNVVLDDLAIKIKNSKINFNILRDEKEIIDYICDRSRNKKLEQFTEHLTRITCLQGYDLIGISVATYFQFLFALLLSKKIKSMSNTKIVLGGPFITVYGERLFSQFPIGDYMIAGDGQVPLLRLIEYLKGGISVKAIPSLLYREDGLIRINPREFFPIEDLYLPDFSDIPLDSYRTNIPIVEDMRLPLPYQITRGCIYGCSFCKRRILTPVAEFKSYSKVVKELRTMKERYQSSLFYFGDDAINCSYEYLDGLCDVIIKEKLNIYWKVLAKAHNLDRKILYKMRSAGCRILGFGIESGSNRILKRMGKGFNAEQASQVLRDSYEAGIKNKLALIVGFPHEKEEDMIKTVEFIKKNSEYIDTIPTITPLRIEYGVPLYNHPERFGIENLRPIFGVPLILKNLIPDFDVSHRLEVRYYAFDEIGGLKWEEKIKQQDYFYRMISMAHFKYVLSKKYRIGFIPFTLYFWLTERLSLLSKEWFLRLLELSFAYLNKKTRNRICNYE